MKAKPPVWLEKHRLKSEPFASESGSNFGAFLFPVNGVGLKVICSEGDPEHWIACGLPLPAFDHVSVSTKNRCPTWEEMHYVKMLFWDNEETVIQYHPPKSKYVNAHPYCLHLWKPVGFELPIPPQKTLA